MVLPAWTVEGSGSRIRVREVCAKASELLRDKQIEEFFWRLIQRVMPKSKQQCLGEVVVTRIFLENFSIWSLSRFSSFIILSIIVNNEFLEKILEYPNNQYLKYIDSEKYFESINKDKFHIYHGILDFFLDDGDEITNIQKDFYEDVKFPNYDNFNDFGTLIDKATKSIFAKKLDDEMNEYFKKYEEYLNNTFKKYIIYYISS